ncbi:ribonuclease H-like domain-containing protein [Tanacetum coccineum]
MYVHGFTDDEYEADDDQPTLINKLDLSIPLHLHPNDSATLTAVSVKLKGTENFQVWSCVMLLALERNNKTGFIDGTCRRAKHFWDELKETYDKVDGLNALWKQFDALVQLPRCPCHLCLILMWETGIMLRGLKLLLAILDLLVCFKLIRYPADFGKRNNNTNASNQGANQHLTYTDKNLVNVIDISYLGITVSHPNETEACITKVGNMVLNKVLTLYDVLVIPEYCVSLMSVHKVARDSNLIVAFDESKCFVLPQISFINRESPYKLIFNKEPNLNHLRNFGCLCYATILTISDKFNSRSKKYVLVGYSSVKKGYKLYSLERKQFLFSRDVKFVENVFPFKTITTSDPSHDLNHSNFFDNLSDETPDTPYDEERVVNTPNSDGSNSSQVGSPTIDQNGNKGIHSSGSNGFKTGDEMAATLEDDHYNSEGDIENVQSVGDQITQPVRRSERSFVFHNKYNDLVVDSKVKYGLKKYVNYSKLNTENKCFVTELHKSVKPKNYWEACKDQHWVEGMNKEMDALYKNDTWEITDLPIGRKSIGGNWVYKIKYKSNGEIERYKARYVAKGSNQKEGIDFDETFSPVVKIVTVRCLINLAVQNGWLLSQLDINNAFLYGDLSETVYMDLPEGFGKTKIFLGIEVLETKQGLCLSQRKYCLDLLSSFGLLACRPSATPLEQNLSITNEPTDVDKVLDNISKYQRFIGKLIYLTHTRPDISYLVHCLSLFMHKPLRSHLKITLRVLRYLKGNPGKGIHIVKQPKASLEAFMDADNPENLLLVKVKEGFKLKFGAVVDQAGFLRG